MTHGGGNFYNLLKFWRFKITLEQVDVLVFIDTNVFYQGETRNIVNERLRCRILQETNLTPLMMMLDIGKNAYLFCSVAWIVLIVNILIDFA